MCTVGTGYGPGLGTLEAAIASPLLWMYLSGFSDGAEPKDDAHLFILLPRMGGGGQTMILHHSLERTEVTNDDTVRGSYKV